MIIYNTITMRLFNYGLSHLSIHYILEKYLTTSSLDKMKCIILFSGTIILTAKYSYSKNVTFANRGTLL